MWRHFPTVFSGRPLLPIEPGIGSTPHAPAAQGAETVASLDTEARPAQPVVTAPAPVISLVFVPELVGLPSDEARRAARMSGLRPALEERGTSYDLWGRVLEQEPAPGLAVSAGAVVTLAVGARPHVVVPDVRGRDEEEALSMLREAGLGTARRAARRADGMPEGSVVRTRPRAGAEVAFGSRVSYVVATGSRTRARKGHDDRRRSRPLRLPDGSFFTLPED